MTRNATMAAVGVLSVLALVTAALGLYRVFSFVAAATILSVFAVATIERSGSEFDLAPYAGLIGLLGAFFLAGLAGIWLTWAPGAADYSYALGLPIPTLLYFGFIWLLPLTAAIYYAFLFDRVAGEEIVESVLEDAREAQRRESFPLAPDRSERPLEATDGGERADE
ncbi:hypothetical protein [Natronococcus jeotgali]|uniref:Uncharacterized protein n=1 Tax=Natronococcus jeotgali DSM 18795 TaxID=1227498 RepID=L9XWQ4_9EURY|nr:hypothetical protein [Natronococcus jeotgali]ELY66200.1 hypothetical protein C492_01428 [Natronococcus jeotgali DSM 18795]